MSSWRDQASQRAQQDLDTLLNAALPFAQQQLAKHGEFFPYATAIGMDGEVKFIAGAPDPENEHPSSADVLQACLDGLVAMRDTIRAASVVSDVRVAALGGDAIAIKTEHAEGLAIELFLPYRRKRLGKGHTYGDLIAQPAERHIWTT